MTFFFKKRIVKKVNYLIFFLFTLIKIFAIIIAVIKYKPVLGLNY